MTFVLGFIAVIYCIRLMTPLISFAAVMPVLLFSAPHNCSPQMVNVLVVKLLTNFKRAENMVNHHTITYILKDNRLFSSFLQNDIKC